MTMLRRLRLDPFLMILIATIVVASVAPVSADGAMVIGWVSNGAIFLLFFMHGARLKREAIVGGLRNWRLQVGALLYCFILFPMFALGTSIVVTPWLPAGLAMGIVFLGVLPTTVQSSIAYASIARGNIAGSVIASAVSNLVAVIATPVLLALLIGTALGTPPLDNVGRIALLLFVPFVLGQLFHTRLSAFISRHATWAGRMDKLTIVLAVFIAFVEASRDGLWGQITILELGFVTGLTLAMLLIAFATAWWLGGVLRLAPADRASLLFTASHKSLATGAPMARILLPAPLAGPAILPLMLYHQMQLMLSAIIAERLAKRAEFE